MNLYEICKNTRYLGYVGGFGLGLILGDTNPLQLILISVMVVLLVIGTTSAGYVIGKDSNG